MRGRWFNDSYTTLSGSQRRPVGLRCRQAALQGSDRRVGAYGVLEAVSAQRATNRRVGTVLAKALQLTNLTGRDTMTPKANATNGATKPPASSERDARNGGGTEALPEGVDAQTFKLAFAAALAAVRRNQSALRETRRARDERLAERTAVQAAMDAISGAPRGESAVGAAVTSVVASTTATPQAQQVSAAPITTTSAARPPKPRPTCRTCGAERVARTTMCTECYSPRIASWPRQSDVDLPVPELVVADDAAEVPTCRSAAGRLQEMRSGRRRQSARRGLAGVMVAAAERLKGHAVSIAVHGVLILAIWSLVVAAREMQPQAELGIPVAVDLPNRGQQPTPLLAPASTAAAAETLDATAEAMPTENARIDQTVERPQQSTVAVRSEAPSRESSAAAPIESPFAGLQGDALGRSLHGGVGLGGTGFAELPVEMFGKGVPGLRIVFALDRSGSMASNVHRSGLRDLTAWDALVRELYRALDAIAIRYEWAQGLDREMIYQRFAFDIVCYDSTTTVFRGDLVAPTRDNIGAAKIWVRQQGPRGGTDWNQALDAAHAYRDLDTIYFFSDGYPSDDAWIDLARNARRARDSNFNFLGVQFGNSKTLTPRFEELIKAHEPNARGHVVTGEDLRSGDKLKPARQSSPLSVDVPGVISGAN